MNQAPNAVGAFSGFTAALSNVPWLQVIALVVAIGSLYIGYRRYQLDLKRYEDSQK